MTTAPTLLTVAEVAQQLRVSRNTVLRLCARTELASMRVGRFGRLLRADEQVHHVDGDKSNDAIDNLVAMTCGDHARHHALERARRRS